MSDFAKNEAANYQAEVRKKLTDLKSSLNNRWVRWDDWERKFIHDVVRMLDQDIITITPKQYAKVWDLWERSLR